MLKKFFFILSFPVILFTLQAADTVYFVPGWYSEWIIYSNHVKILQQLFPESEVKVCKWDSNRLWSNAKLSAGNYVKELAGEVLAQPENSSVILIGHSLGGRLVLDTAAELAGKNRRVEQLILLGTAGILSEDDMKNCRSVSRKPVINIYCPEDNMLKLFLKKEKCAPLGFAGLPRREKHFRQFMMAVPDKDIKLGKVTVIPAKATEFFRDTAAHLAKKYLHTLSEAMSGSLSESYPSETP